MSDFEPSVPYMMAQIYIRHSNRQILHPDGRNSMDRSIEPVQYCCVNVNIVFNLKSCFATQSDRRSKFSSKVQDFKVL